MIRLLARTAVNLIANAIGLWVASLLLDDMGLTASGFVVAVLIFTGVELLVTPMIRQMALKQSSALLGSTALVATLVSLIVATIVTDGLDISGIGTWVLATVIVWAVSLVGVIVVPMFLFKQVLSERSANQG